MITIADEQVYVRTATTDLSIARSSLLEGQYRNIQIAEPSVIIDAGAHIGTSAIFFAKKYTTAKVLAIEPEQGNYDILLRNTKSYPNIIPVKAALWGANETRVIQNRFTGHWGYTVSETDNKTESTDQQVDCITIGRLMEKYEIVSIDILKMDIEGAEKAVFETADDWIDKVQIITIELHDRICMGCEKAFYLATRRFSHFEKHGEIVTAYREYPPTRHYT